ncbi:hypothetical protein V2G26_008460 [Clonostachys chloroleuca]
MWLMAETGKRPWTASPSNRVQPFKAANWRQSGASPPLPETTISTGPVRLLLLFASHRQPRHFASNTSAPPPNIGRLPFVESRANPRPSSLVLPFRASSLASFWANVELAPLFAVPPTKAPPPHPQLHPRTPSWSV